jgi:transposase
MASFDKTSVRAEVSRLKTDFEQLCAEGNITAESKVLMVSMFMIVELILSIFLGGCPRMPTKS